MSMGRAEIIECIVDLNQCLYYSKTNLLRGVINDRKAILRFNSCGLSVEYLAQKKCLREWMTDVLIPSIGRLWSESGVMAVQIESTFCLTSDGNLTARINSLLPGASGGKLANSLAPSLDTMNNILMKLRNSVPLKLSNSEWLDVSLDALLVSDIEILVRHSTPIWDRKMRLATINETAQNETAQIVQADSLPFNSGSYKNIELKEIVIEDGSEIDGKIPEHLGVTKPVYSQSEISERKGNVAEVLQSIYKRLGKGNPIIFRCDSFLQLIAYPLVLALKCSESKMEQKPLRKWLKSEFDKQLPPELRNFSPLKTIHSNVRQLAWNDLSNLTEFDDINPDGWEVFNASTVTKLRNEVYSQLPPVWLVCSALDQWFGSDYHHLAKCLSREKGTPVMEAFFNFHEKNTTKKNKPFNSPYFFLYVSLVSEWWGPWETCFLEDERLFSSESLCDWSLLHRECSAALLFEDIAFVCENPPRYVVNTNGQRFDRFRPTLMEIQKEDNIERRRQLIELYGLSAFMLKSGYRVISQDSYGTLIRKEMPNDEPIVMVIVENATQEQGVEPKKYMLRVPPDMCTAKEAVAWTFGLTEDEYDPVVES